MGRGLSRSGGGAVIAVGDEGQAGDLGRLRSAADDDLERGSGRSEGRRDIAHGDGRAERGREAAAGDDADPATLGIGDLGALASRRALAGPAGRSAPSPDRRRARGRCGRRRAARQPSGASWRRRSPRPPRQARSSRRCRGPRAAGRLPGEGCLARRGRPARRAGRPASRSHSFTAISGRARISKPSSPV